MQINISLPLWVIETFLNTIKKYVDFTVIGEDCTNFAYQVIADKKSGRLKFDGTWYCSYARYGNISESSAWINADSFKSHLIYSGKGRLIKRGCFEDLITPQNDSLDPA
ncbi:hypothetical protein HBE96_08390 [Clostridium sp. P21]|uniref:Putative amidase domain-containing protein n=1 Tax=Clostridium muellerianum TaxID=2716538 RepID=A0A7Y0EFY8_9CLOT|nr:amidase domain-containing protein [Clostridium muellerianum]NMM62713.1 hypothetical protein [Clostridium muellerianum]